MSNELYGHILETFVLRHFPKIFLYQTISEFQRSFHFRILNRFLCCVTKDARLFLYLQSSSTNQMLLYRTRDIGTPVQNFLGKSLWKTSYLVRERKT